MKFLTKLIIKNLKLTFLVFASFIFGAVFFYYQIFPFNYKTKNFLKSNFSFLVKKTSLAQSIDSLYYKINLEIFDLPSKSRYGGIDFLDKNNLIYVDGDGQIFLYKIDQKEFIQKKNSLSKKIINNRKNFINYYPDQANNISLLFNIKDIHVNEFNKKKFIFFSSNFFDEKLKCHKINLYKSQISSNLEIEDTKLIYSTKDCLKKDLTPLIGFAGGSSGGRIFKLDEENVLLTIGDFSADGVNGPILSQNTNSHFGKILKINIFNSDNEIFSLGHRNPQGLFIDEYQNIFSVEHGPKGGDELNIIKENANYGWPFATYGVNYTKHPKYNNIYEKTYFWPLDINNTNNDFYEKPIFVWGPKYAVSNLLVYSGKKFKKWGKKIIISTLYSKQITLLGYSYDEGKVYSIENIKINKRIRDIIEGPSGNIYMMTEETTKGNNLDFPKLIILKLN
ncbi:PQQ-dependent sugar dehydrogenase [Candidatus Pelagibacter bacterium nBUS_30]|uniref:PQQ-dependent sugar dehydrogenase n=1 Tax=Candidatus Pelagibacter bacterium nBUS_30 TaxID=3374191 RepID=UPI003EBD22D4